MTINKSRLFGLAFLLVTLFSPIIVLADNCCSSVKTIGSVMGGSVTYSCDSGPDIKEESCKSESISNGMINRTFVKDSSCNDAKDSCLLPKNEVVVEKTQLKPINFTFNVPLPGFPAEFVVDNSVLPNYITWLYKFVFAVAGLLAVFMITLGGIIWIFAGGNSSKVSQAKEYIVGAVTGLILAIFSYSILYIINPQLIANKIPNIVPAGKAELDANYNDPGQSASEYWNYDKNNTKTVKDLFCYKQGFKNWGSIRYGKDCKDKSTLATAGCGPTSLAMIVSTLKKQTITPDVVAKKVEDAGGRHCGQGTSMDGLRKAAINSYKLSAFAVEWKGISDCLSGGGYVIAITHGPNNKAYLKPESCKTFTGSGHYVIIGAINGSRIEINDPANPKVTGSQSCFRSESSDLVKKCSDGFLCVK